MRAKHRKRTVLLALTSTHHGFYRGAARYAAEHDWHVVADMIYDATIPVGWKGDGILSFVGHWEELAKYLVSAGVPIVEISSLRKDLGIPGVMRTTWQSDGLAPNICSKGISRILSGRLSAMTP